jgi:hypothetical protein
VWDDISSGHVGIISKIVLRNETTFKIFIQQGNSSELQSVYNFSIDPKTKKVTVQNANDGTSRPPPKWWLRVK